MKFSLVFNNTGDSIPFDITHNDELIQYFVEKANADNENQFSTLTMESVPKKIKYLHDRISKVNEVLTLLISQQFDTSKDDGYLNQRLLNKLHSDWALSQKINEIDIDVLRFSDNSSVSALAEQLHSMYPDEVRQVKLAPLLDKLGLLYDYEEINMGVHRLERSFRDVEFMSPNRYQVFDNPFMESMTSNNDIVNFKFGYTYVGRQYFNKFEMFDDALEFDDHYNYEQLEFSFNISLEKPQTIPHSIEFINWAKTNNVPLITAQLPIGNIPDLSKNLFNYRKIIYNNSIAGNSASLIIH